MNSGTWGLAICQWSHCSLPAGKCLLKSETLPSHQQCTASCLEDRLLKTHSSTLPSLWLTSLLYSHLNAPGAWLNHCFSHCMRCVCVTVWKLHHIPQTKGCRPSIKGNMRSSQIHVTLYKPPKRKTATSHKRDWQIRKYCNKHWTANTSECSMFPDALKSSFVDTGVKLVQYSYECWFFKLETWSRSLEVQSPQAKDTKSIRLMFGELTMVCLRLSVSALWLTGDLSRMLPASCSMSAAIGSSAPTTGWAAQMINDGIMQ